MTAKTRPLERPILAEAAVERPLRPRYSVFEVLGLAYSGIPVTGIKRREQDCIDFYCARVLACLGRLRTAESEERTLRALDTTTLVLELMRLLPSAQSSEIERESANIDAVCD